MPRTIKKYANRRLYDTQASRHVTLDGIRQLVASGEDVVVTDDTSGQDITRSIDSLMAKERLETNPERKETLRRRIMQMMRQEGSVAVAVVNELIS